MGRGPRNPGCTCCDTDCVTFQDAFDRADDTDLGSDWTEVSGDWEIVSNALTTASTSAMAICTTTISGDQAVWITFTVDTLGDKFRIIMSYVDSSNYIALEVEAGDHQDAIRVFVNNGSGEAQQGETQYGYYTGQAAASENDIFCCLDKTANTIRWGGAADPASIGSPGYGMVALGTYPDGSGAGLGTGDTVAGTIQLGVPHVFLGWPEYFPGFNFGRLQDEYSREKGCIRCESCVVYHAGDTDTGWATAPDEAGKTNGMEVTSGTASDWASTGTRIQYTPAAADDSTVLTRHGSPDSDVEAMVSIGYVFETAGTNDEEIRIIVNAIDDSNYLYADIVNSAAGSTRVRLGKRTTGTDADITTDDLFLTNLTTQGGTTLFHSCALCYASGVLALSATATGSARSDYVQAVATPHATGYKTGFRAKTAAAAQTITLSSFSWVKHRVNSPRCFRCCGEGRAITFGGELCREPIMSSFIQVEITGSTDLDGTYILYANSNSTWYHSSRVWVTNWPIIIDVSIFEGQVSHDWETGASITSNLLVRAYYRFGPGEIRRFASSKASYDCQGLDESMTEIFGGGASCRVSSIGDCGTH